MAKRRLIFEEWLVERGHDPRLGGCLATFDSADDKRMQIIQQAVKQALQVLTPDEREIVVRLHYMGQTYRELSEKSGRPVYRLESLHRRAMKRLRKELRTLVKELYGIDPPFPSGCLICSSPFRDEIDRMISQRDPKRSWRSVLIRLREDFGIRVRSPQTLIGHKKYH